MAGNVCQRHSMYSFDVQIQGTQLLFQKVSKIAFGIEVEEIREGGNLLPDKTPGFGTVENVTFEKGVTDDEYEIQWFKIMANGAAGVGVPGQACDAYKRPILLRQLARDKKPVREYNMVGAFPVKLEIGDWDSESNEKVVLSMECAYDYPIITTIGAPGGAIGNVFA